MAEAGELLSLHSAHCPVMSKQTRTIVLTVIATLFVVFALQNLRDVPVRVIVWTPSVPLVVLIALVFLAGGVAGWFWRKR